MKKAACFIFILFFIFHFSFFILVSPAYAQSLTTNTNPDVPKNLHTWTQSVMIEVMSALSCQLAGVDPINKNQQCLGVDKQTGKIGFVPQPKPGEAGGAIGIAGNIIAMTYTPPLHTGDYFSYLAQNFGVAKPAYAQTTGTGFEGLSPILSLWVTFRNIVYMLFVAIFAIVGFAIMFRVHIDPRTVMSVSNQLPKMLVSLLLITFSFAISGFLIDLMWVSVYATTNVIAGVNVNNEKIIDPAVAQDIAKSQSPMEAANKMGTTQTRNNALKFSYDPLQIKSTGVNLGLGNIALGGAEAFGPMIRPIFDNGPGRVLTGLFSLIVGSFFAQKGATAGQGIGTVAGTLVGLIGCVVGPAGCAAGIGAGSAAFSALGKVIGLAVGAASGAAITFDGAVDGPGLIENVATIIIFIVIITAMLSALLRLAFELIKSYIFILIGVVFSPFWIAAGLIPSSPIGFGAWLKEIISNLSVFPVTIAMFLLGNVFMNAFGSQHPNQFVPPLVGNPNAANFGTLIGIGIILMTPGVVSMMKELLKAPQIKQTAGIGQAVGVGLGAINVPEHAQKLGMMGYYSGHIRDLPFVKDFFGRSSTTSGPPPGGKPS